MKLIRYHPATERELNESFDFYEERQPGLGDRWLDAVEAINKKIQLNPAGGRPVELKVRKRRVADFPYDILFLDRAAHVFIIAVAHHSRHPDY